jgi:hypothetical protein
MKRAALASIGFLFSLSTLAATRPLAPANFGIARYASPNGNAANNGASPSAPWSLSYALSQAAPPNIIILLPGTYPSIEISLPGTRIVSQTKWGARVVGSPGVHGIVADNNVGNVTIDGIEVAGSALDGINLNGTNCVVRNCWVHGSSANGICVRRTSSALIERNLIERNGTTPAGGQGICLSGTNCILRANVLRYNQGWGCQVYEATPYSSAECDFYNNLIYGNAGGLTVWSPTSQTNYVFNNTILSPTNDCLSSDYGILCVSNNILVAGAGHMPIAVADGATVWADYNLANVSTSPGGQHDVVTSDPGFVNVAAGLFWLAAGSPAIGAANQSVVPVGDFFGKAQLSVNDIGAFQYDSGLASDVRTLDPSTSSGADYWAPVSLITTTPGIIVQPQSQTVTIGQSATFNITAVGTPPLSYQWTFKGLSVGSNSGSYTRPNCQLADSGGSIRVTIGNGSSSLRSSLATLTVNPPGTNYFVATNGSSTNSGLSADSPWSLNYALANAGPSNIITLLPGVYPSIPISQSGTTLRSQTKWAAKIVGTPGLHGIWTSGNSSVSNVVVDGFEVSHSYIDGVKFNGPYSTVRNCWIHHSGRGDPNAVTNTDFSFTGQGVSAFNQMGTVIEYNLIEYNGMAIGHDHGIYFSGTNAIVRGNVIRYNLSYGVQAYDDVGECQNSQIYNNLIYGNRAGLTVWSRSGFTNYVFNNTISSATNYCVVSDYGHLVLANNILIVGSGWYPTVANENGSVVETDFNLVSKSAPAPFVGGPHDVVANDPGFENPSNGLYWLSASSPARGIANSSVSLPVDFFGRTGVVLQDVGAFQYDGQLVTDTRLLDPSSANPDYWSTTFTTLR